MCAQIKNEIGIEPVYDGLVNRGGNLLSKRAVFGVIDHSDDLIVRVSQSIRTSASEKAAERALIAEEPLYKGFVDNDGFRFLLIVIGPGEIASCDDVHSHCVEIAGSHGIEAAIQEIVPLDRSARGAKARFDTRAAHDASRGDTGSGNAGQ